jgi:Alpha-L-arabinofuranosidase B (ABFB) domain
MLVRRKLVVTVVVVACVACVTLVLSALNVPKHAQSWPGIGSRQWPLIAAANRIQAAADAAKSVRDHSGYAGLEIVVPRREVRLFWKGNPDVLVGRELEALRSTGLGVVVFQARFSRDELLRRADELKDREKYPGVVSISLPANGMGVDVGVLAETDASGLTSNTLSGIPIHVHRETPIAPYSIRDDAEPVSAGSLIAAFNEDSCGSSFSAWAWRFIGTTPQRAHYTLAAAHCKGQVGDDVFSGNGPPIGKVESVHNEVDSIAVRTSIWSLPRMYERVSASSWRFLPVTALGSNIIGTYVCQAGVAGGPHCGLKITKTDESVWYIDHWVDHIVAAANDNPNALAAVEGDSGSPVYLPYEQNLLAMGSLWGAEVPLASCPPGVPSGRCATAIRYVDLGSILSAQHLSLAVAGDPSAWPPVISLTADAAHPRAFVHAYNLTGELSPALTDTEKQEATFWNISSVITAAGGHSLESTALAGYYLRQRFGRAVLCPEHKTAEFSQAATFRWWKGFADPLGISLEPVSVPGNYLHVPTAKGTTGPTTIGARPWPLLSFDSRPVPPASTTQWDLNTTFYPAAPLSNPQSVIQVQEPTVALTQQVCGP